MSFVDPEKIIEKIDLAGVMSAADFGAGAGFYTIALAKALGPRGKVYALDIRKEMLEIVRSKARAFHLSNVEALWADLDSPHGSNLKDLTMDLVVISNILFQIQSKEALAAEALRILKPRGKLILVEWSEDPGALGPPLKDRITRRDAENLFLKAGFLLDREFQAGEHHYGLLFKKP